MSTRKLVSRTRKTPSINSSDIPEPSKPIPTAVPPTRVHASAYHWPLFLTEAESCTSLLEWFETIEDEREMPWRKKWIDPQTFPGSEEELQNTLAKRAYEVWVSEIMLQQTRISTVIPYFQAWMDKWPTVQDLSKANHDEVLSVWKGLGYYSRATRLHQGAARMVFENDRNCPIPSDAEALQGFPGIGKYTAGAISSIAFGMAEPVLDGNVIRVLIRQLGLYVDGKDKKSSDVLWKVADRLVKHVSGYPGSGNSDVPGKWNQALMELGSTICTPRPKCEECPIRKTCRSYAEGEALLEKRTVLPLLDLEDGCSLCDFLETDELQSVPEDGEEDEDGVKVRASKKRKVSDKRASKISHYFSAIRASADPPYLDTAKLDISVGIDRKERKAHDPSKSATYLSTYCSLFPKKGPRKKVAEEECVVCLIESQDSSGNSVWLIEKRPAKGLLASLWQFPQSTLQGPFKSSARRRLAAEKFASSLDLGAPRLHQVQHSTELGTLTHIFTHIKLTMHVYLFRLDAGANPSLIDEPVGIPRRKWVCTDAMDGETLSTGMRKCWQLVKTNAKSLSKT
ncbi:DNA glycosylase [Clohesyomyces aquaticus]|uniref:Adenine DNA glycosylase n=1 Tax=Clohesyomyces aquaticus TaxID=1231657 RepID=A0A1Y1ZL99_9PLEO|nr:DNA glycosylase [Clohesyomyces aquaticus]